MTRPSASSHSPSTSDPTAGSPSFEASLAQLETIVKALEEGNLSLEDSVQRFQEGMALFKVCRSKLEEAERTIEKIVKDSAAEATAPFHLTDDETAGR